MSKHSLLYFSLAGLCAVGILMGARKGYELDKKHVSSSYSDTLPKKQYFVVMKIPSQDWLRIIDTTQLIMNNFGKSFSVDVSEVYRAAMVRQLNRLASTITIDSVEVKAKK